MRFRSCIYALCHCARCLAVYATTKRLATSVYFQSTSHFLRRVMKKRQTIFASSMTKPSKVFICSCYLKKTCGLTVVWFYNNIISVVDSFKLGGYENGCSIISCVLQDDSQPYIVVGTAFADPQVLSIHFKMNIELKLVSLTCNCLWPQEPEPTRGRILVFAVNDGKLDLAAEKEVKGAVYCLNPFNSKLLACINNKVYDSFRLNCKCMFWGTHIGEKWPSLINDLKVQLFKWVFNEGTRARELVQECGHHGHILALYAVSRGDFIVVGDLMKSISLLAYKPIDGSIEEIARCSISNFKQHTDLNSPTHLFTGHVCSYYC